MVNVQSASYKERKHLHILNGLSGTIDSKKEKKKKEKKKEIIMFIQIKNI